MLGRLLLLALATGACAGARPMTTLRDDDHDQAYLETRRREDGCRRDDVDRCCAEIEAGLDRAVKVGSMQDGAEQLELLALSCRRPYPETIALFRERDLPDRHERLPPRRGVSLSYDVQVDAGDRIYWAGAFIDRKQPVWEPVPPGPHDLDVEVHVLPTDGVGSNQLYRLRKRIAIAVPADKSVSLSVMVRRTLDTDPDRAFAMLVRGYAAKVEPELPPAPLGANVTKGALLTAGSIHAPTELFTPDGWTVMTKICVNSSGRVVLVEPLVKMHPRDVGSMIDWIIRQKHDPYRIDGVPTGYCYPIRFQVETPRRPRRR